MVSTQLQTIEHSVTDYWKLSKQTAENSNETAEHIDTSAYWLLMSTTENARACKRDFPAKINRGLK